MLYRAMERESERESKKESAAKRRRRAILNMELTGVQA